MADTWCTCSHERRQHDRYGCTWQDPDGSNKCRCPVTYMELSPRADPAKKKR